jgi:catechol 2,3-dioxygenase-like lactoylglutathione lyase family enzyme
MVETHGLAHISLAVRDPQKSLKFYSQVFGVREYFRAEGQIQVKAQARSMYLRLSVHLPAPAWSAAFNTSGSA